MGLHFWREKMQEHQSDDQKTDDTQKTKPPQKAAQEPRQRGNARKACIRESEGESEPEDKEEKAEK